MVPAVKIFGKPLGFMTKDQIMKLTAIKQSNQLTKQACVSYHRVASLLLALGFSLQLNHALQGGFFSIF